MASKDIVGTLQKVVLNGVTYRVSADVDITHCRPAYKNEAEEMSSGAMRKMTAQAETVESVSLKVNADELETLKSLAESADDISMSYVTRAGDTYRTTGFIAMDDGASSATGKCDIKMIPTVPTGWVKF